MELLKIPCCFSPPCCAMTATPTKLPCFCSCAATKPTKLASPSVKSLSGSHTNPAALRPHASASTRGFASVLAEHGVTAASSSSSAATTACLHAGSRRELGGKCELTSGATAKIRSTNKGRPGTLGQAGEGRHSALPPTVCRIVLCCGRAPRHVCPFALPRHEREAGSAPSAVRFVYIRVFLTKAEFS